MEPHPAAQTAMLRVPPGMGSDARDPALTWVQSGQRVLRAGYTYLAAESHARAQFESTVAGVAGVEHLDALAPSMMPHFMRQWAVEIRAAI